MAGDEPKNVVFVTYSYRDEVQVQNLAEDLRKKGIPVYAYPFDLEGASDIVEGLAAETGAKVLAVALSANSIRDAWIRERIKPRVIQRFRDELGAVYLLKLVDLPSDEIRSLAYPVDFQEIDLNGANYGTGIALLAQRVGHLPPRSRRPSLFSRNPTPAPYTMTSVFEPARPAHEIFTELKRQIARGAIDQKYLYWDVRAVLRWQRIAEVSSYMTVQMAMNLLAVRAHDVVSAIVQDSGTDELCFINLGVGTGVKDYLLLSHMLKMTNRITYVAVDESFPMIQLTMSRLEELLSNNLASLSAHYIVDDFRNLDRQKDFIERVESSKASRVIGFDNGLGNFNEREILRLIEELMRDRDYLLLGVEYVAGRSDEALIKNYSDRFMKEFLSGPISDATGIQPEDDDFRYEVWLAGSRQHRYSDVPGSKVVVGKVRFEGREIQLFYSTKFDQAGLEHYLTDAMGMRILKTFTSLEDPPRYGLYLLKMAEGGARR